MFTFLLIVQTIVAAALVIVILMQRSEGGGLGVGGSSSGLMSARGAADFLTRATAVLAVLFVVLSIALAGLAAADRTPSEIDASLATQQPAPGTAPATAPNGDLAIPGITPPAGTTAPAAQPPAETNGQVPLAQ